MSMRRNSVSIRETVSFLTKRESPQLFAHRDEETYQPDSEYAKANTVLLPGTYSASSRNSEHINTSGWKMNPKQFYVQEPPAENQATSSWTSKIPLVSDTVSSKGDKRKDSAVVVKSAQEAASKASSGVVTAPRRSARRKNSGDAVISEETAEITRPRTIKFAGEDADEILAEQEPAETKSSRPRRKGVSYASSDRRGREPSAASGSRRRKPSPFPEPEREPDQEPGEDADTEEEPTAEEAEHDTDLVSCQKASASFVKRFDGPHTEFRGVSRRVLDCSAKSSGGHANDHRRTPVRMLEKSHYPRCQLMNKWSFCLNDLKG
jgi:hypothetical protein